MPKFPTGGKIRVSRTEPSPSVKQNPIESEVKYYGLQRDEALFDIEEPSKALAEVLKDVQDPAEASTEGLFSQQDVEIIDGVVRYNLKNEDFRVLLNASLNVENEEGVASALVNPRQRIADRIKQLESFAGRGTLYQGQGTTMFKYVVPTDARDGSNKLYSHTNPPPFFKEAITSTVENAPDYIPVTTEQISRTHRVGFVENGIFIPSKEPEYWWSGEYNRDARERAEYGAPGRTSINDPKFPIVKDGNLSFEQVRPEGIPEGSNWGLRFDTWFKKPSAKAFGRFVAQVSGHLRIDYFEKTGYNSTTGAIQGSWRTALDTTNPATYFLQNSFEEDMANSSYGFRRYFVQGGPSTDYGAGTGTLPDYAARMPLGGAFDYSGTFDDLEGNAISKFDNGYVPVVIRFWYGQQDPSEIDNNSTIDEILASEPSGPPSLVLDHLIADNYSAWNDYSSRVHFKRVSGEWVIQNDGVDTSLSNFNAVFEIFAYKIGSDAPDGAGAFDVDNWTLLTSYAGGRRKDDTSTTIATFDIPGLSPQDDDEIWLVVRNRPWSGIPYDYVREELFQRFLFDPNIKGEYETAADMLEGVGDNYSEPDPAKVPFQENLNYYKSKLGQLPVLGTYGPDRYDGMLPISLTTAVEQRDYDYSHDKLLFIGRQRKGTSVKPLQTGEIRNPGENYTFFEVLSDEGGNGGNVIINAFPANNLGILAAGDSGTFGKALHLTDNIKTYSNSSRQNIQKLSVKKWPTAANFDATQALKVRTGADNQVYLYIATGSGTTYNTYDTTGIIASDAFGTNTTRNHDIKELFISGFKKSNGSNTGTEHYFYGLVGGIRESIREAQLTTQPTDSTKIRDASRFPNIIGANSYTGTQLEFRTVSGSEDPVATARVTSFDSATNEITYTVQTGTVDQNTTYFVDVWFNHIKVTKIPDNIVSSTGVKQVASSHIADGSNVQISYTHSGAYQYSRADNGTGLSFSETLFFIGDDSDDDVTENRPFLDGTEVPAPPADIVTPFGYDNTITDSDPGLGGLCYPPYRTQSVNLFSTALTTTQLDSEGVGNFDTWWGGRDNLTDLGGRYLEVTNKLVFDFNPNQRATLLEGIASNDRVTFTNTTYTHKLEVELNVEVPTGPTENIHIYKDAQKYSNNKPVKDRCFLFINKQSSALQVLSSNDPAW